jgi:hypothetical protein
VWQVSSFQRRQKKFARSKPDKCGCRLWEIMQIETRKVGNSYYHWRSHHRPGSFFVEKNSDTNLPRSPCLARAANEPNLRASPPATSKRLLKRGRADFRLAAKNRPAPAASKTCRRVLEPKLLAGAPEPALARQDPIEQWRSQDLN